ncbi:hypothetical protein PQX77_021848 [Marasmius sp. AFHP31]|nr:hypothetical protein PQX77_021848 [Marasmius sp. AFHP31]
MHGVCYPFPQGLFYWSHDPQGRNVIAEADWEKFGVPELSVEEWVGTYWNEDQYTFVQDHLRSRSYNLDGNQYARDHGYPELILADPHDIAKIEKDTCSDSDPEAALSHSQLTLPSSLPSGVTHVKCDSEHADTSSRQNRDIEPHWAKPGFLRKWCMYLFSSTSTGLNSDTHSSVVSKTIAHADIEVLDYSVVAC